MDEYYLISQVTTNESVDIRVYFCKVGTWKLEPKELIGLRMDLGPLVCLLTHVRLGYV